jgi:hypothetical protein
VFFFPPTQDIENHFQPARAAIPSGLIYAGLDLHVLYFYKIMIDIYYEHYWLFLVPRILCASFLGSGALPSPKSQIRNPLRGYFKPPIDSSRMYQWVVAKEWIS